MYRSGELLIICMCENGYGFPQPVEIPEATCCRIPQIQVVIWKENQKPKHMKTIFSLLSQLEGFTSDSYLSKSTEETPLTYLSIQVKPDS